MDSLRYTGLAGLFFIALIGRAGAQELVVNGDFESGLTGWTNWSVSSGFWNGSWIHSNDCDIWVPTNGCPFEGAVSHAQKKGSGSGNAHGGIYQVLNVIPGNTYQVSGQWSGGVTGNVAGSNGTWWEVVVYDGVVADATIDAGVGPNDVLIAKHEVNNLGNNEVFQFQWESFDGTFTAQSSSVTLAFKTGSYSTFDAAGYHDVVSVTSITPALSLSPGALDFGGQEVGTTSAPQSVMLQNTGDGDLDVSSIGPVPAPFSLSGGTCGAAPFTLAPGNSCTLEFVFSPTSVGTASGTVDIASNAPGSPDAISVTGSGFIVGPIPALDWRGLLALVVSLMVGASVALRRLA